MLDLGTKEQLKVAEHYKVEISDKCLKNYIRLILKANLMESGILEVTTGPASAESLSSPHNVTMAIPSVSPSSLLFEQQKELLLLQLEHDRQSNSEKLEHDRVKYEKELAFKQDMERAKIKLQQERMYVG